MYEPGGGTAAESIWPPSPAGLTAWLAAPPRGDRDARPFQAVLDELIALAVAHGVRSALTDEPRSYRLTPRGRAALSEAIAAQRAHDVTLATPVHQRLDGDAVIYLRLQSRVRRELALDLGVTVIPGRREPWPRLLSHVTHLITHGFDPLDAGAAFVSVRHSRGKEVSGDQPLVTAYEQSNHLPPIVTWPAIERFVRGVFWGMGLGPGLCARLGGPDRVAHEAPVPIAQRLGRGVWLQTSEAPPAQHAALSRLAEYLVPVLPRSQDDVLAVQPALPIHRVASGPPRRSRPAPRRSGLSIPVRFQGRDEKVAGLNIRFAAPITQEQRALVKSAVRQWFGAGFAGRLGGELHWLGDPSISAEGDAMRWTVDFGDVDPLSAMEELTARLATLAAPRVEEVVLGTDEVG